MYQLCRIWTNEATLVEAEFEDPIEDANFLLAAEAEQFSEQAIGVVVSDRPRPPARRRSQTENRGAAFPDPRNVETAVGSALAHRRGGGDR